MPVPEEQNSRQISEEEQEAILNELMNEAEGNEEFQNFLNMMINNDQLRPNIFNNEDLLYTILYIEGISTSQMINIINSVE